MSYCKSKIEEKLKHRISNTGRENNTIRTFRSDCKFVYAAL